MIAYGKVKCFNLNQFLPLTVLGKCMEICLGSRGFKESKPYASNDSLGLISIHNKEKRFWEWMKWSPKVKYFNFRFQGTQKLTLEMLSTGTSPREDQNLKSNLLTQSVRKNVLRKLTHFVPPIHTVKKNNVVSSIPPRKPRVSLLRSSTKPSFFLRWSLYLVPVPLCTLLPRWIFEEVQRTQQRLLGRLKHNRHVFNLHNINTTTELRIKLHRYFLLPDLVLFRCSYQTSLQDVNKPICTT